MSQKKNRTQQKPKSEIKLAEERFQNCIVKRNSLNDDARALRDERNSLHDQRSKVMEEIMKYRDEMKSNTTAKTKHQNTRNSSQEKAKKLIELKQQKRKGKKGEKSLKDTVQALHSEILNLEKRRETTEMPIAKERELMDRLAILRRSLGDQEENLLTQEHLTAEVSELDKDIDAEFSKADEEHKEVINLARLNKKLYKKVSNLMKEASHLSTEADKKHKEFVECRKKADSQHAKAMEMLDTLKTHRKTASEERQARWKVVKDHRKNIKKELYDEKKLDNAADDALEQLMSGGKISL
ncbi:MAG TPA: hypothetical protein QGI59_01455 [Candidatus Poseidoniia archaeon]|jgi:uncharacterized coiled-coil DUF342 family protein|nr:hypothetical protein [Candidatus Poseidoniia archaeon]|tara:strand:- start:758 stop:1648 length:891 start_codon:yes stop_codon:yes gene_type:complete